MLKKGTRVRFVGGNSTVICSGKPNLDYSTVYTIEACETSFGYLVVKLKGFLATYMANWFETL